MWKTIVLCASLFGGAVVGLVAVARWIEPSVLPALVAIGLCLVGVVLILAAPPAGRRKPLEDETPTLAEPTPPRLAMATGSHNALGAPGADNRAS